MTRSHRGGDIRVVIVDDDVAQLEPLAQLLRDNDLEVHATSDSGAAVDLVVAVEPAVVILDVHMPEPDGFEVCRRLQESIEPPPAVIFLSGDEDTARLIEGLEVGAIDYVSKGADVRGLVAKVRAIAELASRLRELAVHALQDPLTEVGNRRAFDEEGAAMLAAARRHRRTLSCLAIDLDRFKAVND
ncbi:MAG: response regulator, partial [Planctomycetes bacterium]|nr:response regulator [Planctomycetota bacterium]